MNNRQRRRRQLIAVRRKTRTVAEIRAMRYLSPGPATKTPWWLAAHPRSLLRSWQRLTGYPSLKAKREAEAKAR